MLWTSATSPYYCRCRILVKYAYSTHSNPTQHDSLLVTFEGLSFSKMKISHHRQIYTRINKSLLQKEACNPQWSLDISRAIHEVICYYFIRSSQGQLSWHFLLLRTLTSLTCAMAAIFTAYRKPNKWSIYTTPRPQPLYASLDASYTYTQIEEGSSYK